MPRRSVDEHAARIAALVAQAIETGVEEVPLADAIGRVSAAPIRTAGPLPAFRNSQMDGYAARAADLADAPVALPVDGSTIAAAAGRPAPLPPGRLMKVMTGAPLPDGADVVVPVEDAVQGNGLVRVLRAPGPGEFVREIGSDAPADVEVVPAGVRLAPRHLAAAAAAGVGAVPVRRRVRVAVVATGAEVAPPGSPLLHGQVHDANGVGLAALAVEAGAEVVRVALVGDDPAAFRRVLAEVVAAADLVLTAGGISKGDFEVVRQVLEPQGADIAEIAMQPGGPQATAIVDGVPVVAFPGNPVSAQVSFTVLLRPLLRAAARLPPIPSGTALLATAVTSPAGRRQWLRAAVAGGVATPVGGPGSHLVTTMAAADHLIDVPAETTALAAGEPVRVLPL